MAGHFSAVTPIPYDFKLEDLVDNHKHIVQVEILSKEEARVEGFNRLVERVINDGKPVLVDGYHDVLDHQIFSAAWLHANHGHDPATAWDLGERTEVHTTIGYYLNKLNALTAPFFDDDHTDTSDSTQSLYLKDLDCPETWLNSIKAMLPSTLHYLDGDSTGQPTESAVPAAVRRSGDLMSSLPPERRTHNLMCYIGHEGTHTPMHQTICASVGINIMVEATEFDIDDERARQGSSLWFMTKAADKDVVARHWRDVLRHDIDHEDHFASLRALAEAPFTIYVAEQTAGEMVLLPPMAPYQVWNRGTRTTKIAWSINNPQTTRLAITKVLSSMQQSYQPQSCQIKAMVYFSLLKYNAQLRQQATRDHPGSGHCGTQDEDEVQIVVRDFKQLLEQFEEMILKESFQELDQPSFAFLGSNINVTCSLCHGIIFNRFLSSSVCREWRIVEINSHTPVFDICLECYAGGRASLSVGRLHWTEQYAWSSLISQYNTFCTTLLYYETSSTHARTPFAELRATHDSRTLIERCQDRMIDSSARHLPDVISVPSSPPRQRPDEWSVVPGSIPTATIDSQHVINHTQTRKQPRTSLGKQPRLPNRESSDGFVDYDSDDNSRSTCSQSPDSIAVRAEARILDYRCESETGDDGHDIHPGVSSSLPRTDAQVLTCRLRNGHNVDEISDSIKNRDHLVEFQCSNTTFVGLSPPSAPEVTAIALAKRKLDHTYIDDSSTPPKRRGIVPPMPRNEIMMQTRILDGSAGQRQAAHQWLDDVLDQANDFESVITLCASANESEMAGLIEEYTHGDCRNTRLAGHSSPSQLSTTQPKIQTHRPTTEKPTLKEALQKLDATPGSRRPPVTPRSIHNTSIATHSARQSNMSTDIPAWEDCGADMAPNHSSRRPLGDLSTNTHRS